MKNTPKTVILTAPQGFGKTTHANQLREWFGFSGVVDDWTPSVPLREGHMHLTNFDAEHVLQLHGDGPIPFVMVQISIHG